jgi:hypothetical protein
VARKYTGLQNLIERAVILSNEGVLPIPLPKTSTVTVNKPLPTTLRDSEYKPLNVLQRLSPLPYSAALVRVASVETG